MATVEQMVGLGADATDEQAKDHRRLPEPHFPTKEMTMSGPRVNALDRVRVLDLSRMVAGGVAGMLLADFGADVVKVEQPGTGRSAAAVDCRGPAVLVEGLRAQQAVHHAEPESPNEGRALLLRVLPQFDVVMESFVPGTLERLGTRPGLSCAASSGPRDPAHLRLGPDGSRRRTDRGSARWSRPRAASPAMNGEPDGAPIVPSFPLADATAGAVRGQRDHVRAVSPRRAWRPRPGDRSVARSNRLFSLLGPLSAEYAALGKTRSRNGSRSTNAGPRGCYRTQRRRLDRGQRIDAEDGRTASCAHTDSTPCSPIRALPPTKRASCMGSSSTRRSCRAIGARTLAENVAIIETHKLTAGPVHTVADIERDPHWRARQLTVDVPDDGGTVRMHGVVPRSLCYARRHPLGWWRAGPGQPERVSRARRLVRRTEALVVGRRHLGGTRGELAQRDHQRRRQPHHRPRPRSRHADAARHLRRSGRAAHRRPQARRRRAPARSTRC